MFTIIKLSPTTTTIDTNLISESSRKEWHQVLGIEESETSKSIFTSSASIKQFLLGQLGQMLGFDCLAHLFSLAERNSRASCPRPSSSTFDATTGLAIVHQLEHGHRRATKNDDGEEHDEQGGGDDRSALLLLKVQMQRQRVSNCAAQSTEPHDEHHARRDLVLRLAEIIHQIGQRVDVEGPTQQTQHNRPDNQREFDFEVKRKDRQAKVGEHASFYSAES